MTSHLINLDHTFNSGQVFLWKKTGKHWYAVNGQDVLKINCSDFSVKSILKKDVDFFRQDSIEKILKDIRRDAIVKQAEKKYRGLQILRQDPFQCLISFIVSSNSNIQKIKTNLEKLCEGFGEKITVHEKEFFTFPTPEKLADAKIKQIQDCGTGYRSRYIKEAAKMVSSGRIDFEDIKNHSYFEAKNILREIPGIGNKVADCVLLFSLDKLEAFPLDRWMIRILQKYYSDKFQLQTKTLTEKQYDSLHEKIVNHFGLFAGYSQQFLFKMERENLEKKW